MNMASLSLAVAIHAWQLAREGAQPRNQRRQLYHSLDSRQFLRSMSIGKIEAEIGHVDEVNACQRTVMVKNSINSFP